MQVLISGAGVAGLTAAYRLPQYEFAPVVVERAASLVVGGDKIDVPDAALGVVRRMGLYEAIEEAGSLIDARTERVAKAANAIELMEYSALVRH